MSRLSLRELQDREFVRTQLIGQKLSPQAAEVKASLFANAAAALDASGTPGAALPLACFVPGRIEILGKHTDYAGGRSIVAAIERGICLVAVVQSEPQLRVTDVASGKSTEFPIHVDLVPQQGDWSNYPMTVARRVARNFTGPFRGARIAFASDLPPAAGMSSSSALVTSMFLAISAANDLPGQVAYAENIRHREELAGYLASIENGQSYGSLVGDRGVGTFGGSEDHTAILCARPGRFSQYAYSPVRFERCVAPPKDHCLVVAVSGVVAEKTKAAMAQYNRISQLAAAAVSVWRTETGRADPHLAAAIRSSPGAADAFRRILQQARHPPFEAAELVDRFEQFLAESERIIPEVDDSLRGHSLVRFGQLVDESQSLGARLLKNQVPQTVFLAESARELGAVAASAFGAGFGGSVWAMVETNRSSEFCRAWPAGYRRAYPQHEGRVRFEVTGAGPAAFHLDGTEIPG